MPARTLDRAADDRGVLWVDVQPTCDPARVLEVLVGLDRGVTADLVADLLDRDDLAKVREVDGGIRNVSVVGMVARPADSDAPGEIVFQMVETLVGDGWLVTCWQDSLVGSGNDGSRDEAPILREKVEARVARAWARDRLTTSGDLATALVHALAEQYRPAHRTLEHWLQVWETDFHAGRSDREPLKQLLAMINDSRRRLAAFNNMRRQTADGCWFPHVSKVETDRAADKLLDHALDHLRRLVEDVRADMELVCMERMVAQAESAKAMEEADRNFQTNLGRVTALLLVPTLIAGVFGANTALPGGGTWMGFEAMVALMIATSAIVYLMLVRGP